MNKLIIVAVVVVIIGSVGILLVPNLLNQNSELKQNPENNVLQIKEAYWSGENGRFYFEVHNPTDRYIENVVLHLEISGYEEIYDTQNIDYDYFNCYGSESFAPNENVTFGSKVISCYFDEIKVIGIVGTEYVIEKTVSIEQRGETFEAIDVQSVSLKFVDSYTLKTIISVANKGTVNIGIAEVYINNKECSNYNLTYPDYDTLANNGEIPVNRNGYICIYLNNMGTLEIGEEIRIRYKVVTPSGISEEGSVPRKIY